MYAGLLDLNLQISHIFELRLKYKSHRRKGVLHVNMDLKELKRSHEKAFLYENVSDLDQRKKVS